MRRRLWLIGVAVAVTLSAAQTVTLGAKRAVAPDDNEEIYQELELFEHALSIVRSDYVEEPEARPLIYGALKGMLATLDPYSQFLDPDNYNELKVDTQGQFGGLGIEITIKDDLLTIITPIDDTPAYDAGLRSGDRIVKIDGELTRGITIMDAVKKLRGKPKTEVVLTILREGESELKDVRLERAIIKIQSVREAKMVDGHIGYIRVSDFRERTTEDLEGAIRGLKEQALEGLILDLRNNPGGLLDVAVSVSELFLDRNQLIVSTRGRIRDQNQEIRSHAEGVIRGVPLVVLINEGSASASEIVAGAIQDHHRGILLGTKSHGKGSVQTIFPLKDGSALRLTTSKWFTPDGRPIHGQGIKPDVEVALEREPDEKPGSDKAEEIFNRIESTDSTDKKTDHDTGPGKHDGEPGASPEANGAKIDKGAKKLDNQLARAVDLLKGIKVYELRNEHARAVN